jgi:hypothetical protein
MDEFPTPELRSEERAMSLSAPRRVSAGLLAAIMISAPLAAGGRASGQTAPPVATAHLRLSGIVTGVALHRDNRPLSHALLRLRDATTGRSLTLTRADDSGRFRFDPVPPGSYVVELVDENGRVLAIGQMFSLAPHETVATVVRLGTDVHWYGGFFIGAAAAAMATAAIVGVTAVSDGPPASPRF